MKYTDYIDEYRRLNNEYIRDKSYYIRLSKNTDIYEKEFLLLHFKKQMDASYKMVAPARKRIAKAINSVENKTYQTYLTDRLLLDMTNEETSEHMNYCTRNIYRISKPAFRDFKNSLYATKYKVRRTTCNNYSVIRAGRKLKRILSGVKSKSVTVRINGILTADNKGGLNGSVT